MSTSRFDEAAATWDEEPGRIALARTVAEAILGAVPVRPSMVAIDFGCGTGLLTLALQPAVGRIIGVDSSPAMLAKLQEKVEAGGSDSVETRLLRPDDDAPVDLAADLIVSAMTLHHIPDLPKLLRLLTHWLRPGGYLALADLDAEDGSFHHDPRDVHHFGIDREWLTAELRARGLSEVSATTAQVIERPDREGKLKKYPVFLVAAKKAT